MIKINEDELEDIGIVSHYKNKPFTGLAFVLNNKGEEKTVTEFKNGLKHGKQIDTSFADWRFESMRDEFKYTLYYEEDKCINYGENYIKMRVNMAYRAYCLGQMDQMKEVHKKISSDEENFYTTFLFDIKRNAKIEIINKAISELIEELDLRISNNSEEINFFKEQNKLMKSLNLADTDANRNMIMQKMIDEEENEYTNEEEEDEEEEIERIKKRENSKNIKHDIFNILEKKEINNIWVNFQWIEPNREFDEAEEWIIDDFILIGSNQPIYESGDFKVYKPDGEEYKVSKSSLEKWQIMTVEKENQIIEILSKFMHPYDYTGQDANCLLKFDNGILTYTIEEDWINGFFNSETGNWDEVDEDSAFKKTWKITDEGIIEIKE
ncbi:hypothetical protein N8692_03810 [Flavobacteriales bacterium]|nr:hypothetical protein [Flavobacteriales bacterium]MDC3390248.1 hypothetical protein [Flavobacteriales bacterium]